MKTLIFCLSQALTASLLLAACGGNVVVDDPESGGGGTSGTIGQGGATTPTSPTTAPTSPPDGPGASLAVRRLLIGDTTPDGLPSSTAWKQYGLNLDGKVSTKDSKDLCKPSAGAKPAAVYEDGDAGIDNSFGRNVLPIFTTLSPDTSMSTNALIEKGGFSVVLRIVGIGAGYTGTFLTGAATAGFPPGQGPQWDGLDVWPLRSSSLNDDDPWNPYCQYPKSGVTAGGGGLRVWQSYSNGCKMDLVLVAAGFEMKIPIKDLQMTAFLSEDNSKMTSGAIGGVIDTEMFIGEMAKVAGSFDASLCPPSATFESIAQQIRQASDILSDGSQDPNQTCDAISIGLGFEAEKAEWGEAYEIAEPPNPCQP